MNKVYEIAHNKKEAEDLARNGFGYESKKDAEKALASPEIDSFYRNQLRVFEVNL